MDLKSRTLSNFAELVKTGECKKFKGRLKVALTLELQTQFWLRLTPPTVPLPEFPLPPTPFRME